MVSVKICIGIKLEWIDNSIKNIYSWHIQKGQNSLAKNLIAALTEITTFWLKRNKRSMVA